MSNDKHTPTPWRFDKTLEYIFDANDDYPILEANSFEAAERAVQCVNACDGIYEPEMFMRVMRCVKVKSSKVTDQGAEVVFDVEKAIEEMNVTATEIATLRAEKAELIEALRDARTVLYMCENSLLNCGYGVESSTIKSIQKTSEKLSKIGKP